MTPPLTWEACAAAGMSATEAARAMGRSPSAAVHYARRKGLTFPKTTAEGFSYHGGLRIAVVFGDEVFAQIKAKALRDGTSFAEAVRALCEIGLGRAP